MDKYMRYALVVFLLAWGAFGIWGAHTGQLSGIKGGEFGVVLR